MVGIESRNFDEALKVLNDLLIDPSLEREILTLVKKEILPVVRENTPVESGATARTWKASIRSGQVKIENKEHWQYIFQEWNSIHAGDGNVGKIRKAISEKLTSLADEILDLVGRKVGV